MSFYILVWILFLLRWPGLTRSEPSLTRPWRCRRWGPAGGLKLPGFCQTEPGELQALFWEGVRRFWRKQNVGELCFYLMIQMTVRIKCCGSVLFQPSGLNSCSWSSHLLSIIILRTLDFHIKGKIIFYFFRGFYFNVSFQTFILKFAFYCISARNIKTWLKWFSGKQISQ